MGASKKRPSTSSLLFSSPFLLACQICILVLILYIKWVHQPSGQEQNLSLVEAIFSTFPTQNESLPGKSEDTFGVEHDYEGGDVGEFDFFFCFSSEIGSRSR